MKRSRILWQMAFSLVELLLALAILSVMLLLIVPYTCELTGKNRVVAHSDALRAALRFTRSSAILLGEPVILCGSRSHKECDGLWPDGQIVITYSGRVLRVLSKISSGDKLKWASSREMNDSIVFLPTGLTDGQQNGSFYYCPKNNPDGALRIVLSSTGRTRISKRGSKNKKISCNF